MKRITIVVAGLLSVLLIACGGSSDPDSGSQALTHAELIAQGDALCQQANDDFTPLTDDYSAALKARDYTKAGEVTDQMAQVAQQRTNGLESLEAPAEDADAIDQYAQYSQQTVALMKSMAGSLRAKDSNAIAQATEGINSISGKAQKTAQQVGFEKCGSGSQ